MIQQRQYAIIINYRVVTATPHYVVRLGLWSAMPISILRAEGSIGASPTLARRKSSG
jgi:hypothetical protein